MHTNVEQKNALNNYITPIIEEVPTKSPTALGIEQSTQTDLSPRIEDASTRTTSLFAFCPIHFAHLKEKVILKGDFHFIKCLVEECFLFCAKDSTDKPFKLSSSSAASRHQGKLANLPFVLLL